MNQLFRTTISQLWIAAFLACASVMATEAPLPDRATISALPEDGGGEFNRLIFEHSPYLLQHARNPVDWYPWGDAAFKKAKDEGKLVFLSVGYSTCHWCHVMAHESFEDREVAALLNEGFVAVKVDREERPDIDEIYMTVTQAMTGSGGWPMTVILTPDRNPVFAGTYFPKEGSLGRPGLMNMLPQITEAYSQNPDKFAENGESIAAFLRDQSKGSPGDVDPGALVKETYENLAATFDATHGGFGGAPKFPTPHQLSFLLRSWKRTGDSAALSMVETTLTSIRRGGIFDHVGLGFHRYSVDAEWKVPHFEKMLYDQALLAIAYTETFQATQKPFYADTAREIFTYVLRDLTSPEGGFYCAEDADSEGEEGKFYVWTKDETTQVLGEPDAALFDTVYNIREDGNWEEETGKTNIPHITQDWDALATAGGFTEADLRERMASCRTRLFEAREARVHPHKDDKILTDWNGLMIAALAKAGRALDAPEYATAAVKAADFLLDTMRTPEGRLQHRYRLGQAGMPAQAEDYAFFVWGLLEVYESTFEVKYLQSAIALNEVLLRHYWDATGGGFFMSADDAETLITRPKSGYDGALPSANSVAALNLIRLARMTGDTALEGKALEVARAFGGSLSASPTGFTQMMIALDFVVGPSFEVVIAGEAGAPDTQAMLGALNRAFVPNMVVLFRPGQEDSPAIGALAEYTLPQKSLGGAATAYVCKNFACNFPTTDVEKMLSLLDDKS